MDFFSTKSNLNFTFWKFLEHSALKAMFILNQYKLFRMDNADVDYVTCIFLETRGHQINWTIPMKMLQFIFLRILFIITNSTSELTIFKRSGQTRALLHFTKVVVAFIFRMFKGYLLSFLPHLVSFNLFFWLIYPHTWVLFYF